MGMMNRRWRIVVVFGVSLFAAAACEDGEDSVATTAVVTAAPESTVLPSSSSTTVTGTAMATTVLSTAPPPPTPPDTTSPSANPVDIEAAKAAVIAAAIEANSAFRALEQRPSDPAALERLLAAVDGQLEQYQVGLIAEMIVNSTIAIPNPVHPADFRVDPTSVIVDAVAGTASAVTCEVNSWILISIDTPTGSTVVVDDSVSVVTTTQTFALIDGSWRLAGGDQLARREAVTCE